MSECQICHGEDAKIKIYVVSPTAKTVQTVLEFCDDCYDESIEIRDYIDPHLKVSNWRITTYDKNEEVTETFVIENRTEKEAEKEAMSDVNVFDCWDWTMVEVGDEMEN